MPKHDFKVGQPVWHKRRLGYHVKELVQTEITKVGRKYLTVGKDDRYHIDTLQEDTIFNHKRQLYLSEEEYVTKVRHENNREELRKYFRNYSDSNLTLEQTEQILQIIKGANNE